MTTTLNSVTIVDPYEISIERNEVGSVGVAINGTKHFDYFRTTLDYDSKIKMKWRLITSANFSTLKTQLENCITANRTIVLPDGQTFSVRLDPESALTQLTVRSGGTWLYNVECGFLVIAT